MRTVTIATASTLPRGFSTITGSPFFIPELKNQKNETCMKGNWNMLVMSKPK